MGMNWDFTNYTFSFLVSLIGTILGVCYPLFLENIRKIDDQYQSTVLAKKFQEALVFKVYRMLLIASIIVSFLAPFVMLISDNVVVNIGIETVHCLFVLALVLVMLYMFKFIQTYYNPDELSKLLFEHFDSQSLPVKRELLMASIDLMRYSCERNNMDVYQKSKGYLINMAALEQKPIEYSFYNLSPLLQDAIKRTTELSTDETLKPLCYDNILVQIYYDIFCKGFNGENNYRTIWWSLNRLAESENTEWFQQYWSAAISYYGNAIINQRAGNSEDLFKNQARFWEFHHAVGAMLVYQKKYEWLHYILTIDNVSPPKFYLIPGSLKQIIFYTSRFERQTASPWDLSGKYQMKGTYNDINSDYAILQQIYRYFTLLVIRLFSYNDYNIGYCEPMQSPDISEYNLAELKALKETIESLKREIKDYWYVEDRILKVYLPVCPTINEVTNLLNGLIDDINNKIQFYKNNPQLDTEKFEDLKSLLADCDNKSTPLTAVPTDEEKEYWEASTIAVTVRQQLDADICSTDGYNGWSNFPEVLVKILNQKVASYMDDCYSFIEPIVELRVSEQNLFAALEKLQIPEGYVILAMGVYMGGIDLKYNKPQLLVYDKDHECTYGRIPVIEQNSAYSVVYVIKQTDLLKMETSKAEENDKHFEDKDMLLLEGSENNLYTNIDKIIEERNPKPVLKIGKNVCVYTKPDIQLVRIRVSSEGNDSFELERMKSLKEYLGTEK